METISKLEKTIAGWYKQLPFHLPAEGRKWLAENAWWLVLIGVVVSVFGLLGMLRTILWAGEVSNSVLGNVAAYYGVATYNPWTDGSLWISLASLAIILVLEAMAINPLKLRKKRGWDLMFLTMLVSAASALVTAVVTISLYSILLAAVGLAIGGFFLFEVREQFGTKTAESGSTKAKK